MVNRNPNGKNSESKFPLDKGPMIEDTVTMSFRGPVAVPADANQKSPELEEMLAGNEDIKLHPDGMFYEPAQFQGYEVLQYLGGGGKGGAFLVRKDGKEFVLKISFKEGFRRDLSKEASSGLDYWEKIDSIPNPPARPNVVRIEAHNRGVDNRYFIVYEKLSGEVSIVQSGEKEKKPATLMGRINAIHEPKDKSKDKKQKDQPTPNHIKIAVIGGYGMDGLESIHESTDTHAGQSHGDVKPENIMFSKSQVRNAISLELETKHIPYFFDLESVNFNDLESMLSLTFNTSYRYLTPSFTHGLFELREQYEKLQKEGNLNTETLKDITFSAMTLHIKKDYAALASTFYSLLTGLKPYTKKGLIDVTDMFEEYVDKLNPLPMELANEHLRTVAEKRTANPDRQDELEDNLEELEKKIEKVKTRLKNPRLYCVHDSADPMAFESEGNQDYAPNPLAGVSIGEVKRIGKYGKIFAGFIESLLSPPERRKKEEMDTFTGKSIVTYTESGQKYFERMTRHFNKVNDDFKVEMFKAGSGLFEDTGAVKKHLQKYDRKHGSPQHPNGSTTGKVLKPEKPEMYMSDRTKRLGKKKRH